MLNNIRFELESSEDEIDHNTSDDWYTPPYIFEALGLQYEFDVSGPPGGLPWIPANKTFSILDDGLFQNWGGGKVWMNPPYSNPKPWVEKFIANGNGVALVPTSTGIWMLNFWSAPVSWLMLEPMRFVRSNLVTAKGAMPIRCWLVAIGDDNVEALRNSGLGHVR